MPNEDRYYLGSENFFLTADGESERLVQRLRQYLDLRNVSLLIGNGASIPLGAPTIGNTRALLGELRGDYALSPP